MKRLLSALAALASLTAFHNSAHAQIHQGDWQLSAASAFFSFEAERREVNRSYEQGLVRYREMKLGLGVGTLDALGVGVAYAVTPYVLPSLFVSFQTLSDGRTVQADGEKAQRDFDLLHTDHFYGQVRPGVEVAIRPHARIIPYGFVGMSLGNGSGLFTYGPAVGAGVHGFVVSKVSLELGAIFRGPSDYVTDTADGRRYELLLSIGASRWL